MTIPVIKLVCNECGKEFDVNPGHFAQMGFKNLPKRCPTCLDKKQLRPSIVQERKLLNVYDGVEIVSLPDSWQKVDSFEKDLPSYQMIIKGSRFGASWSGRIDIFASHPFRSGDVVSIREMEAQHIIKVRHEYRSTMHYGTVAVTKELPVTTDNPEAEEVIRTRRYLVLEPHDKPATCHLVWTEARTKTTLKGLGRQYHARVSGAPIAKWEIWGGYRSGRAYTTGILAIVDKEHPLYITVTGDIQEEKCYE